MYLTEQEPEEYVENLTQEEYDEILLNDNIDEDTLEDLLEDAFEGSLPQRFIIALYNKFSPHSLVDLFLLRHYTTPSYIIRSLYKHWKQNELMLKNVILNPNCPDDVLKEIIDASNSNMRNFIAYNIDSQDVITYLYNKNLTPDNIEKIATNQFTPHVILEDIFNKKEYKYLLALVLNQNISGDLLGRILSFYDVKNIDNSIIHLLGCALLNPNITIELLEKYCENENIPLQIAVARNSKTSTSIFDKLVKEKDVHSHIFCNPSADILILEKLNYDNIRGYVIEHIFESREITPVIVKKILFSKNIDTSIKYYGHSLANPDDTFKSFTQFVQKNPKNLIYAVNVMFDSNYDQLNILLHKTYGINITGMTLNMIHDMLNA
jgi:hypothetical protein